MNESENTETEETAKPVKRRVRSLTKKKLNAKRKGTRKEHRCIKQLEQEGYDATRSAASLGAWDVIGVGPMGVRVVQVKSNRRPGREEMALLESKVYPTGVSKELWIYHDGTITPTIEPIKTRRAGHIVCHSCGELNPT